ncbi:HNH endonuclease [Rhizobium sp. RU35A]|uniref:HNH endonuclease signature motif containing protein n=1 Tax=Rhizobium sp. RU35A TaxID=1907414 RepID=UPI000954A7E4|nr:HNH endonuclease signature motif containing protein [Rhizobium sp. RU35A]SIP95788.1 HNH endonuclease [Rhizobium sp. RU35A]
MARKHREKIAPWYQPPAAEICPLCGREIPEDQRDLHHLVPKSRGGRVTQALHRICHKQIHALFSEAELETAYSTVEALLAHPDMAKFVAWVSRKPPGFQDGAHRARRRREMQKPSDRW